MYLAGKLSCPYHVCFDCHPRKTKAFYYYNGRFLCKKCSDGKGQLIEQLNELEYSFYVNER